MILRGLWKLTWIEIKIFLREPLGAFGTIGFPVLAFLIIGRVVGRRLGPSALAASGFIHVGLPVLASLMIAFSSVLSLVTIISIYREGGILKRLRATPLRPQTILTAHVIVKLLLTAATLVLMQPIGAVILYPMIALSGLFVPVESLPPVLHAAARVLPLSYAVSLLEGIWNGGVWTAHLDDLAALAVVFIVCTALSAKVFRWE